MSSTSTRTPAAWAQHDLSARQAIWCAVGAMTLVTMLDLLDGRLGLLFSVGFILIAGTASLSVDLDSLFPTGVLPPVLLFGTLWLVAVVSPSAIQVDGLAATAGVMARLIAGVIDHGMTLVIGHGLALGIIVLRILTAPDR